MSWTWDKFPPSQFLRKSKEIHICQFKFGCINTVTLVSSMAPRVVSWEKKIKRGVIGFFSPHSYTRILRTFVTETELATPQWCIANSTVPMRENREPQNNTSVQLCWHSGWQQGNPRSYHYLSSSNLWKSSNNFLLKNCSHLQYVADLCQHLNILKVLTQWLLPLEQKGKLSNGHSQVSQEFPCMFSSFSILLFQISFSYLNHITSISRRLEQNT